MDEQTKFVGRLLSHPDFYPILSANWTFLPLARGCWLKADLLNYHFEFA